MFCRRTVRGRSRGVCWTGEQEGDRKSKRLPPIVLSTPQISKQGIPAREIPFHVRERGEKWEYGAEHLSDGSQCPAAAPQAYQTLNG